MSLAWPDKQRMLCNDVASWPDKRRVMLLRQANGFRQMSRKSTDFISFVCRPSGPGLEPVEACLPTELQLCNLSGPRHSYPNNCSNLFLNLYGFIQHSFVRPFAMLLQCERLSGQAALIDAFFKPIDLTQRSCWKLLEF